MSCGLWCEADKVKPPARPRVAIAAPASKNLFIIPAARIEFSVT
jgi:hypothetical protein